jgi:L-fuconolactonase
MTHYAGSSRRQFVQAASTAGAFAMIAPQLAFAEDEEALPIIDPHQHLWDMTKFKLAWQKGEETKPLQKSFVMSDYLEATKGLNVVKTVYMEVDVIPEQQVAEADYVIDLCERGDNPMKGAVISGRPGAASFEPYIRKLAKNKYIKGVRQVLHGEETPEGYGLKPKFVESIQLLGDLGLRFDMCLRSGEVLGMAKLVEQCPKTRFVLDHCGNMSTTSKNADEKKKWHDGMKAMAALPNVMCKVSGIVAGASKDWNADELAPVINTTLDTFGEDRVMFAGDWPVCTLRATFAQWVGALKQIVKPRSLAFGKKLFHDNAAKFYEI